MPMGIGDRIRQARTLLGISQLELAALCGWDSQGRIGNYERGEREPRQKDLAKIAKALNVSIPWLVSGPAYGAQSGIQEVARPTPRTLPVITWEQAGVWSELESGFTSGDTTEWYPVPHRIGPRAFILRVRGDSMVPQYPGGKSFPDGTLIVVDPDTQAEPGAFVVARLEPGQEATFKQLVADGGQQFLKPLNPQYKTLELNDHAVICGVVRGAMYFD